MADSEASGDARLDDPVDDPVDMDQLAAAQADVATPPDQNGQYGYLFDDSEYTESHHEATSAEPVHHPAEPAPGEWIAPPPLDPEDHRDDAFNGGIWNFKPAPAPWYRSGHSRVVLAAVSLAVIALVVSGVLLAFQRSSGEQPAPTPTETSAAAPTTETAPAATSELPPPPAPPPPPPPPSAATEVQRAPVYAPPNRPSRKPEINVTRKPMSVAPQKPSGR